MDIFTWYMSKINLFDAYPYTYNKSLSFYTTIALQDSDDDDVEEEIDAKIEQMLSAKRTVKNIDAASMATLSGKSIKNPLKILFLCIFLLFFFLIMYLICANYNDTSLKRQTNFLSLSSSFILCILTIMHHLYFIPS